MVAMYSASFCILPHIDLVNRNPLDANLYVLIQQNIFMHQPMDVELGTEIQRISSLEDGPERTDAMKRVINYILTIPSVQPSKILHAFAVEAYRTLPGSALPAMFARHCGVLVHKGRRVSFDKNPTVVFYTQQKSREAKRQEERECTALSLTNTDRYRKFRPRECFEPGICAQTKIVPLVNQGYCNGLGATTAASKDGYSWAVGPISAFITDPTLMDKYAPSS